MKQRIEHLDGIQVDENDIHFIDTVGRRQPFTVEQHWDEFINIMNQLYEAMERKRGRFLMLTARCVPCDFTFETPIPMLVSPNPFDGICCPQCGNENPNAISTLNYRDWEKKQNEQLET